MKKIITGTFSSRENAEQLIDHLKNKLSISEGRISYVYQNTEGTIEKSESDVSEALEGTATGAVVGGTIGAIAGIATVMGVLPVIGAIFVAGPLVSALGFGVGAVGTTVAGAIAGAVTGGIIGTLVNLGVTEIDAKDYESRLQAGEVLVVVECDNDTDTEIKQEFESHHASKVTVQNSTQNWY